MKKIWIWFVRNASLRKKLVVSYIILVLIPILILGFYSFSTANNNLIQQTEETMDNNLNRVVSEVNSNFQRENDFMKYLAYNLEFRETLEDNAYNNSAIAQSLNKTVEPVFWYFITSDENIKGIKIVTPYATTDIGSFLETDEKYLEESWYQEHLHNFNTQWSTEEGRLYATRTILDTATTSRMIGILRVEFYLNRLTEPIDSMEYLKNGILVLDGQGNQIYSKPLENQELQREVEAEITGAADVKEKTTAGEEAASIGKERYILKSAHIDSAEWEIYYFIDRSMISDQIAGIVSSTLLMVMICILILTVCVGIISDVISKRILVLKKQAEKIAAGDMENPCITQDKDEIGVVTNSLGKMTVRLNEMIQQVYKSGLEKRASELKALQAQINPHFLYNCLSTIKWKALQKGEDEISDITGLLATFYRTSLNNGKQITTVRNELENIKSYIGLEKRMHDGSFEVEYRLAPEGLDCDMPNFLLQPVVENAVKHGIDYVADKETGKIIIEFVKEDGKLRFNIYNNGPLIESEEIDKLMNTQGKRYGIRNIKERIQIYYGSDYGISVCIAEECYTCFSIEIADHIQIDP